MKIDEKDLSKFLEVVDRLINFEATTGKFPTSGYSNELPIPEVVRTLEYLKGIADSLKSSSCSQPNDSVQPDKEPFRSDFTRKEDSRLTDKQFEALDKAVFTSLMELSPYINEWLNNVKEVKNYVNIPIYDGNNKNPAFTLLIKKPSCGTEFVCPFCHTPKRIDFVSEVGDPSYFKSQQVENNT